MVQQKNGGPCTWCSPHQRSQVQGLFGDAALAVLGSTLVEIEQEKAQRVEKH